MISKAIKIFIFSLFLFNCNNDENESTNEEQTTTDCETSTAEYYIDNEQVVVYDNLSDFEIITEGYYLDEEQVERELDLVVYDTICSFKRTIIRNFANQEEKKLISIAESLYPSSDSIEDWNIEPDEITGNLWWYNQFDGIKIPYAITRSAVQYYNDLITFYQAGDFESAETIVNSSAEFTYKATINFENNFPINSINFENVYVVTLELEWYNYCGNTCALFINSSRTVVFDVENNKVYVFGDSHTPVVVS